MATFTHAVTIDAAPTDVWPWIAQLGAGRAGWYSYDRLDNKGESSAEEIVSGYQSIEEGDILPATPGATDAFLVHTIDASRILVLTAPADADPPIVSWALVLEPRDVGSTRLLARVRASGEWPAMARSTSTSEGPILIGGIYAVLSRLPMPLLVAAVGFGHWVMERKMLRGIRRRAEGAKRGRAKVADVFDARAHARLRDSPQDVPHHIDPPVNPDGGQEPVGPKLLRCDQ